MNAAYLVLYESPPDEAEEFLRYYREVHVPIVASWPGVRSISIEHGRSGEDPFADDAEIFMIARFTFDSIAELRTALQSAGRREARWDRDAFPRFTGRVRHQAVEIEERSL